MTKKEILKSALILYACGLGAFTSYHFATAKNHKEKNLIEQEKEIDDNKIFVINEYLSKAVELPEEENVQLDKLIDNILNEEGRKVIEKTFDMMESDKIVSHSIKDQENQIIRLLYILNESTTYYPFDNTMPYYFAGDFIDKVQINTEAFLGLNAYQLALGLEYHEKESLETYMNFYLKQLKEKEITEKDMFDYNLIRYYFLSWENVDIAWYEKYDEIVENLVISQNKAYLRYFIDCRTAIYRHLNPFNGYNTIPEEVKIMRSTPVYGEVTYTLPKEYENVYFLRNDCDIPKDKMKIVETEEGINYTIYDDSGASRIFEIVIPTNNFPQKEESELSLTRKQENK